MPKMKTHKGTAKRFRLTKNGKLMRMKAGRTHLRRKKTSSQNSEYQAGQEDRRQGCPIAGRPLGHRSRLYSTST